MSFLDYILNLYRRKSRSSDSSKDYMPQGTKKPEIPQFPPYEHNIYENTKPRFPDDSEDSHEQKQIEDYPVRKIRIDPYNPPLFPIRDTEDAEIIFEGYPDESDIDTDIDDIEAAIDEVKGVPDEIPDDSPDNIEDTVEPDEDLDDDQTIDDVVEEPDDEIAEEPTEEPIEDDPTEDPMMDPDDPMNPFGNPFFPGG
jgi:hypothetical protein